MIVLEIGDTATPITNIVENNITFETNGIEGIVINRYLIEEREEEDNIYNYQLQFSPELIGYDSLGNEVTFSGTGETLTTDRLWFTVDELGLSEEEELSFVDVNSAITSLTEAKSAVSNSVTIVSNLKTSINIQGRSYDTLSRIEESLQSMNSTIESVNITRDNNEIEQKSAQAANISSDTLGNDAVLLQEVSENIAQLQSVVEEELTEYSIEVNQGKAQKELSLQADEEDYKTYMNSFIIGSSNSNTGSLVVSENGLYDIESHEDLLAESLTPEEEEKLLFGN